MKIALIAFDTRGGVQPYLALALGLQRAGHDVRVVAPSDFAEMIAARGVDPRPLTGGIEAMLRASQGVAERGSLAVMRFSMRHLEERARAWARECLDACAGVDVIAAGIGGLVFGRAVATKLKVPMVEAHLHPLGPPTDAFPGVVSPWRGAFARRLGHRLTHAALWMPFKGAMKAAHASLGAPFSMGGDAHLPVLHGYSRHILPTAPEWGARHRVTGYWFLPAGDAWSPPPALEGFLASPQPVVAVGFGSMSSSDPGRTAELVMGAARRAGVRVVMLSGWGGLEARAHDDVMVADAIPHDWLYPRVRGVVHHGGAGTTGAALRAGVPAQVVPFMMDQPFWGHLVADLGVGPAPIPRRRLSEDRLARALEAMVRDDAMAARAAELGEKIRAEDGAAEAARVFEAL
ncbi:MAG: glycosyltransferase [Polyangiales bacterium]